MLRDGIAVAQPDVSHAGGISEAIPNFLIQEQSVGIHYNQGNDVLDYLVDRTPFRFAGGFAERTAVPGLGIEVDAAAVERAAERGHRWRNPVWRHPDCGRGARMVIRRAGSPRPR